MRGTGRSSLARGSILLVVALVAAGALSPAFGAKKGLTRKKVKKIASRVLTQQLPAKGAPLFVEEDEVDRFGPIRLQIGAPDQSIGTFGPLTLTAHCEDDGGDVLGEILLDTSEDNTAFYEGTFDETSTVEADFDAGEPPRVIHDGPGAAPGGATTIAPPGFASVMTPSGTSILVSSQQAQNLGASHCVFAGSVTVTP